MNEEITCPYCIEDQEFDGANADVFFSEGNGHILECEECSRLFKVTTEVRYIYETERYEE